MKSITLILILLISANVDFLTYLNTAKQKPVTCINKQKLSEYELVCASSFEVVFSKAEKVSISIHSISFSNKPFSS
jgi:hypothetical protein